MFTFNDQRLYVRGIGEAYMNHIVSGNILGYSDKFTTGQITPSQDNGEIPAGLGNALAIMLPTNSRVAVNFTAADFNMFMKAAAVGAQVQYGAPVPVCQAVTADGETLTIDVSGGAPVAGLGMRQAVAYVQEVGAPSPVENGGIAYPIDATGAISGFVATAGTQYKVTYFVTQYNASYAAINSDMNGMVVRFTAAFAVYANVSPENNEGNFWGTFYVIIPMLKLTAEGAVIEGDQTSTTTTGIIGQALAEEESVVTDNCSACGIAGSPLAYYLLVPCDSAGGIEGVVGHLGGVLSVPASGTAQIQPKLIVNGRVVNVTDYAAGFTYTLAEGAPAGTSVSSSGLVTAGTTAGDGEVTVAYTDGDQSWSDVVDISVTTA